MLAIGAIKKVHAQYGFVMGCQNETLDIYGVALGWENIAESNSALALGQQNATGGHHPFADGYRSFAGSNNALAIGYKNTILSDAFYGVSLGYDNLVTGDYGVAIGAFSTANGSYSDALGLFNIANGYAGTVVGLYNEPVISPQTAKTNDTPVFIVGNGDNQGNRSNAMIVRKDGNVEIGTDAPTALLEVNSETVKKPNGGLWSASSDERLKQDIRDYREGLEEVNRIRPVWFRYNEKSGYDTGKDHVGIIAQELEKIAPHMVGTFEQDGEEYLEVDNSAMTYMLINAVKELSEKVDALTAENRYLRSEISAIWKAMKDGSAD